MAREDLATSLVKIYSGSITIRSPEGEYVDSAANFALDNGAAFPGFPAAPAGERPYIGRTYIPGEKHNLTDGNKNVPQRLPWVPGDDFLNALTDLLASQAARNATRPAAGPSLNVLYNQALDALLTERGNQANPPQAVTDYLTARDAPPARG